MNEAAIREKQITRTSIVGIIANIFLSIFKAIVGLLSNSIAIVLDAVNNLTDAMSSVITIVGIKLARKPATEKHPFGLGRIEYFSAIIIALLVLTAGVSSLVESIKKIINPLVPTYTFVTILIVCVAIVTKLLLGRYVSSQGKKYYSDALIASGADASFDAIISSSTLVGAIITLVTGISVDGFVGAIISGFIIKAGLEMLFTPISSVMGNKPDSEITIGIKKEIASLDGVIGAYDLVLHNYGPDKAIGSVHIEIPDTMSAREIHVLTKDIQLRIMEKFKVFLSVGIYAVNTKDKHLVEMQNEIRKCALSFDNVVGAHGIFISEERKYISFDSVFDFKVSDREKLKEDIENKVKELFPGFSVSMNIDTKYSG